MKLLVITDAEILVLLHKRLCNISISFDFKLLERWVYIHISNNQVILTVQKITLVIVYNKMNFMHNFIH